MISRGRRGRLLVGLAALGFVLLAVAPIGPAMLLTLEERFPRPAAVAGQDRRHPGARRRCRAGAFALLRRDRVQQLGVARARRDSAGPPPSRSKARTGRRRRRVFPVGSAESRATLGFVVEQGIAPGRIILEERSRSTHENAVYAKELIRPPAGRDLDSRHLGLSHAARGRVLRCGRVAGDPLSGRLQNRSADRPRPRVSACSTGSPQAPSPARSGPAYWAIGRWDGRAVVSRAAEAPGRRRSKPAQRADGGEDAPHDKQGHPAPIDHTIHCNPPETQHPTESRRLVIPIRLARYRRYRHVSSPFASAAHGSSAARSSSRPPAPPHPPPAGLLP